MEGYFVEGAQSALDWRDDEMSSFALPELDPLPALFPFSPPPYRCDGTAGSQDVADVLLSLKHAVVHPPSPPYHSQSCGGGYGGTGGGQEGYVFPSMSVNVSMTMHGYPPPQDPALQPCAQMGWSTAGSNPTPGYGSTYPTSYSFTADLRPDYQEYAPKPPPPPPPPPPKRSPSPSRPNLCRICGKTYARPSTLKTHLRTHSGEKPYRCDDCNKSFSQAANLTAHVRTHSGEKPFRCPICARRFSQSSSVTTHMRTHSGERPYRCRLCKKAFSDSSTLTKHLRIHSGEKPYQCKLCLLRFSQSGNLNRHMRVHGGSLAC